MSAVLLNKINQFITPGRFRQLMNWYPPFKAMAIAIDYISDDFRRVHISMGLHWYNRNYVGTQFGGALYAMVDPFYMLMLMKNLGKHYLIWDKSAEIFFKRPGRGKVFARFHLTPEVVEDCKTQMQLNEKRDLHFSIDIFDVNGEVICEVNKTIYIKKI
jgi:hypothetical protein